MAATIDDLDFIAPGLAAVPAPDKQKALDFAQKFRPACLPPELQDEAQLYYAAWLLFDRERQKAMAESGAGQVGFGAKRIKEGDVEIEFGAGMSADAGVIDPQGFYKRWADLNGVCSMGAITVSTWRPGDGCGC